MSINARTLGVLLAGGLSRRMGGGDKGLMPLGGKPVMAHAFDRLEAMSDGIIINANGDPSRFAGFEATIVPDTVGGFAGPLAGVLAGLEYADGLDDGFTHVISAAADTPFFPQTLAEQFLKTAENTDTIVLAGSDGRRHPVFGLWPVSLTSDLKEWLQDENNRKVLAWVDRHQWDVVEFPMLDNGAESLDPFFNINTPEDFAVAQTLLEEKV